jgi:Arc/MetJ-type ribon-helix-helix transcriptional regulator
MTVIYPFVTQVRLTPMQLISLDRIVKEERNFLCRSDAIRFAVNKYLVNE